MSSKTISGAGAAPALERNCLSISGELNARDAASFHETLFVALQQDGPLELDARKLASLDTSIVQILLSARRSAQRLGRQFTILSETDGALAVTLQRLGLPPTALG